MTFVTALLLPLAVVLQKPAPIPDFTFLGTTYVHRYSKGNLHEFTPKSQPDLKKFADMVTVNDYPRVEDGEGLASVANRVLETYKANKAVVVRTNSVPRTAVKEAEHLIVALFTRPTFVEASFARFVMGKAMGCSIVYSHRLYGKKADDAMSKWLQKNGPKTEMALMALAIPKH